MDLRSRYSARHMRIHLALDIEMNGHYESVHQKIKNCRLLIDAVGNHLFDFKYHTVDLYSNWYFMKYGCTLLCAIYRLLLKVVSKYNFSTNIRRSTYHNMVTGPRHLKENVLIFNELVGIILFYIDVTYRRCGLMTNVKKIDTLCIILKRVNRSLIILRKRFDESAPVYMDGLPMRKQLFWPWKIM